MQVKRECRNCDFFCIDNDLKNGACRIERPKVMMVPMRGPGPMGKQGMGLQSIFPMTNVDWWCGEFKPRATAHGSDEEN